MKRIEFNILNNHIGYGNPNAEIVFVGLEEGCNEKTITPNYKYRISSGPKGLVDLKSFHLKSGIKDLEKWFQPSFPIQSTWNLYSQFLLCYGGKTSPTTKDRRNYQINDLGSTKGNNALIEFYPLPRPNHNYWNNYLSISGLFSNITEYNQFCQKFNLTRINNIIKIITNPDSKAIILHGGLNQGIIKPEISTMLQGLKFIKNHKLSKNIVAEFDYKGKKVFVTYFMSTRLYDLNDIKTLATLI
jgi:hypothetical protein